MVVNDERVDSRADLLLACNISFLYINQVPSKWDGATLSNSENELETSLFRALIARFESLAI